MIYTNFPTRCFNNVIYNKEGSAAVGKFFNDSSLIADADGHCISSLITSWDSFDKLKKGLMKFNGFFSFYYQTEDKLFAAVDRIRSYPIFYGQKEGDFFLSDNARWVRDQIGDTKRDGVSETEFLLTGYVTGRDTLYQNLKQIQAGECICYDDKKKELNSVRYYQYLHNELYDMDQNELLDLFDKTLLQIFDRLLRFLNGRTAVIPLSGGYDSRLIATMLKRLNYENVITYTYGKPRNKEAVVSELVAKHLGYKWIFIPYDNEKWNHWYKSKERIAYYEYSDGLSSLPHIQDWPAVWELKKKELIPTDSVFIPGLSADLLAGSRSRHFPKQYRNHTVDLADVISSVKIYHYVLHKWERLCPQDCEKVKEKLNKHFEKFKLNQTYPWASLFEQWDCNERQSKFINNSIRIYEFWDYDWYLPFWDNDFFDFWSKIDLDEKYNQKLYIAYVNTLFKKITNHEITNHSDNILARQKKHLTAHLKMYAEKYRIIQRLVDCLRFYRDINIYDKHFMSWYGVVDKNLFKKIYPESASINSILALLYLTDDNLQENMKNYLN